MKKEKQRRAEEGKLAKTELFHIGITNATAEEILEYITKIVIKQGEKCMIVTPNPEMVVYAQHHKHFQTILNQSQISLCDGMGLFVASRFLGKPLVERITGVEFMENLCKKVVRQPITVGFLGGRGGVAEKTAECLIAKYPGLSVVFVSEEWEEGGFDKAKKYHVSRITYQEEKIRNTKYIIHDTKGIDILFVAFGFPKQEEWIAAHLPHLPVKVAMGVGGAFDYISGSVHRAPFFMRAVGGEWLFRLLRQPWRIKRQLALFTFIRLMLREKFSH